MKLEKMKKLKQFERSENGFYALILTLASQTCLDKAIRYFERREREKGLRELQKSIRFAFWSAYLMLNKSEVGSDEVSGFVQTPQVAK